MRNKVLTLFVLALVILFSNCTSVNAIEYKKDSVPNNSYVIGKHIFTENIVLTTKHIMLGATTIDSNKLTDMTIYYKAPWGDWMDGLSGETVNVPDKFDVNYIDTEALVLGDVDQNGKLDIGDVSYILKHLKGDTLPETADILLGDANQDGDIDDVDVSIIQKKLSGQNLVLPYDSGEKYNVTYSLDGGKYEDDERNILVYASISLDYKLKEPTKEGYVFLGWTGSNGTTPQKKVTIEEGTTGNLEYTANWKKIEE